MRSIPNIENKDKEVASTIKNELSRIRNSLELIPSENFASVAVLEALGTVFNCKYSEGYPKKRYYGGNQFVDDVELIAIERAKKAFGVPHANVQPYSGSPANFAVYVATCEIGDTIMGHNLPDGGHLTHGWKASVTGQFFNSVSYHVRPDGYIDLAEIESLAKDHKPRLIWVGATAYVREFPFEELSRIADSVGAYLAADIAHISGLVVGGAHKSPVPYAHIVTTTTHKTLRGPRGGIIMVTQKGLDKDPDLAKKIDRAVFPGLQGGPHDDQTAAIAVALGEALKPEFKDYAAQIVKNAKVLGQELMDNGIKLVTGGTDNHMLLIDLTPFGKGNGVYAQEALEKAGMTTNKNTIPAEPSSPFYPSGIRLGTPALTTRGFKEPEMRKVGKWMADVIREVKDYSLPENKEDRKEYMGRFMAEIENNKTIASVRQEIIGLCKEFPLYEGL